LIHNRFLADFLTARAHNHLESAMAKEQRQPWHAWYNTAAWRRLRSQQLSVKPLCRMCLASGVTTAATVCDHVVPHRGDPELFWSGPFQSHCATCHSRFKQSEERGGVKHLSGCNAQGEPLFFDW
jgi:5-methylcytosine-specific restriction protein A